MEKKVTFDADYVEELEKRGVIFPDKGAVHVARGVRVGAGSVIFPGNCLYGGTEVGENCVLYPNNILEDAVIGGGAKITASVVRGAKVGGGAEVGPNAYLRGGAEIGENCRVGDFVEIKGSVLGKGVKVAHLAYIGDAEVGAGTNVGCGAVFANYDGREKHRTVVGKNCFIGSNANLIAPLNLGDGAFVAAGTTVTESAGEDGFVIGRCRQQQKAGVFNRYTGRRSK